MTPERCCKGVSFSKRSLAWWFSAALSLSALACVPAASAAVTIGQLSPVPPTAGCTVPGLDYLQPSVTGGNLYVARAAGTITSWTTNSSGAGATYVVKVFRRTTDPDSFQVMAHSPSHVLTSGLNTVSVNLPVKSGDMLGYHETGPPNSCVFSQPGDNVLNRVGNLADGTSGTFAPQNDVRLNLSAVLVPDNSFTLGGITRDRKNGTATITATSSNPGLLSIAGKRMKKRPSKTLAVAGPVTFAVTPVGNARHRLARRGQIVLPVHFTFFPTGGDPAIQTINLKLKRTRPPAPSSAP
jgi:hypothetical protein